MAKEFSFDVVSEYDHQELINALDQARKEVTSRYDFKDSNTTIELDKETLTLATASEMQLKALRDVLESKFFRRGIDLRVLDWKEPEPASKGTLRQVVNLKKGIAEDIARDVSKHVKAGHPKAHIQIQGDQLRVSAKDKDALQAVINDLKEGDFGVALQFTNYR